MKTSIVVNIKDNSITAVYDKITHIVCDTLTEYGVTVVNYVVTTNFSAEFQRLVYSNDNDFLITLGNNDSQIKGNIKVFALPNEVALVKPYIAEHIVPFVSAVTGTNLNSYCIKTFGIAEKDIKQLLSEYFDNVDILINTFANDLDVKTVVKYDNALDRDKIQYFTSGIYEKLRKYIYTDEDISIYQLAIDLLSITNKKLAIAETITKGRIVNNLLFTNNCDDRIDYSITGYSPSKLQTKLNLDAEQIAHQGECSVEICYEMAVGLLDNSQADVVLATCGSKDSEFCYIAVGDSDGIHVYKNKCSGDQDRVVDTLAKSAIFYLIKKIKQNDLFFNQIIV